MINTILKIGNGRFSNVQYICFHKYLHQFYDSLGTNSPKYNINTLIWYSFEFKNVLYDWMLNTAYKRS